MVTWVERWYRGHPLLWLLWPLSALFAILIGLRRWAYQRGWRRAWRAPVPVWVVGNLTVGGTGKTPLTLAVVEFLKASGWRPGIVSRGYGAQPPAWPHQVHTQDSAAVAGDEPLLLAQRTGVPVVIDPKRPRAVQALLEAHDCNIIVCDDGLQHLALARDVEWVVVDGARGFGSGWLLPAGPLREGLGRLRTVDAVISQGQSVPLPASLTVPQYVMTLQAGAWQPVKPGATDRQPPQPGEFVVALAGIGHPPRFFAALRAAGYTVLERPLGDHEVPTLDDLAVPPGYRLVMTEKDAVKCRDLPLDEAWYLPVTAHLPDEFWSDLKARLASEPVHA